MTKHSFIAYAVGIAALFFGAAVFVHATRYAPVATVANQTRLAQSPIAHANRSILPVRLLIPSLHIDAAIQHVGITAKGSIGVPDNFTDVAWYEYGAIPGRPGNAIIDGHVDNGLGLSGVFKHLDQIQPGDAVSVVRADGSHVAFLVTRVETVSYRDSSLAALSGDSGAPGLVLITCDGTWLPDERTYDERLVVYATLSGAGAS